MNHYRIENSANGHCFGVYAGDDERAALDACARDAGYRDHDHAQSVAPCPDIVAVVVDED